MAKFCHIAPIPHLDLVEGAKVHLLLAHLVEQSKDYVSFYRKEKANASTLILDNSAFEMYKQGRPMYPIDNLIEMAEEVCADYVVMSDYPNQVGSVTIKAAESLAPKLKKKGFGTFFCPQSLIGDKQDLFEGFEWAAESDLVDYIGVSILAIPNAYGVEKGNKLQRFISRYMFMQELYNEGILDKIKQNGKNIHMLGMLDGPGEIRLMAPFKDYIDTWDSSAAIWLGLHAGRQFDDSPTGLIDGKYEVEVDFNYSNERNVLSAVINQSIINNYISMYLMREEDSEKLQIW